MKQIVSFSGGKDSTAMLLAMLERGEKIDAVIFFDFGMEFPQLYDHIEKVRAFVEPKIGQWVTLSENWQYYFCEKERTILKKDDQGKKVWLGCDYGYSWPTMHIRWCTAIKKNRIVKWIREHGLSDATTCIGIAADETERLQKRHHLLQRYPLSEYGMTEDDCLKYCYSKGYDFGGLYKHFKRLGCFCCPFKRVSELKNIFLYYKPQWHKLLELEELETFFNNFNGNNTILDYHKRFYEETTLLKMVCNTK